MNDDQYWVDRMTNWQNHQWMRAGCPVGEAYNFARTVRTRIKTLIDGEPVVTTYELAYA